jgi:hypothetical protein
MIESDNLVSESAFSSTSPRAALSRIGREQQSVVSSIPNMKYSMCAILLLLWLVFPGVAQVNHLKRNECLLVRQAEVSPGNWVKYEEYQVVWELENGSFGAVHTMPTESPKFWQMDTSFLSIPWNRTNITWVGVGIPISLRAWNNELFMIAFDRDTNFHEIRLRYYRQEHGTLAEVSPKDYPPEIATQNLWLHTDNGTRKDGSVVNEVEIVKALDPASIDFRRSLTAKIWRQLETGEEYYQSPNDVEKPLLESYLKKHSVVRLQKIQPAPATKPGTQSEAPPAK